MNEGRKVKVTYECGLCAKQIIVPVEEHNEVMAKQLDHTNNGDQPCEGLLNPVHLEEVAP